MKIDIEYDYQKEPKAKSTAVKTIRNALLSIVVLLILAFMVGAGYTYYLDEYSKNTAATTSTVDTKQQYRAFKPTAPDPKAPVGAAVQLITSPIARGEVASATIKTYPGATCNIKVMYNKVASTEAGLGDKIADSYGVVSWDWTIGKSVPEGLWPVDVTCAHHSTSGFVQGFILVTAN